MHSLMDTLRFYCFLFWVIMLLGGCKEVSVDASKTFGNKLFVYPNSGNTFYLVDNNTYEIKNEIVLPLPDSIKCFGMIASTNRDYLFFRAIVLSSPFRSGFVAYDIAQEKIKTIYFPDLTIREPADFISADDPILPGNIYVHYRDTGMFLIDILNQNVIESISNEHDFSLNKTFYQSSDDKWDIVLKEWNGMGDFTELEFYSKGSNLHDLKFVLNQADKDSIFIYDLIQAKNNKLYITYLLSGGRSYEIESYLGVYDLETKKFTGMLLTFPWSLNPYYMAYSSARNEIYMIGAYDKFYVIDAESCTIKQVITLSGKVAGPSRILIHPDGNTAFISCSNTDRIFVIDLSTYSIKKTIALNHPYAMIIP